MLSTGVLLGCESRLLQRDLLCLLLRDDLFPLHFALILYVGSELTSYRVRYDEVITTIERLELELAEASVSRMAASFRERL